jgi:nucleoid DNA-binding protein
MANKIEFINALKTRIEELGLGIELKKTELAKIVETTMKTIEELTLAEGDVSMYPYKFKKKVRGERKGINPKTGESITIPEKIGIKFVKFLPKEA